MEFKMGDGENSKYFEINLAIPFNFASSFYYNKKSSKSVIVYETTEIEVENEKSTAQHLLEHLILLSPNEKNYTVDTFHFYYCNDILDVYDSLSLCYHHKNEYFSIIHTLYESKKIGEKKFVNYDT